MNTHKLWSATQNSIKLSIKESIIEHKYCRCFQTWMRIQARRAGNVYGRDSPSSRV